VSNTSVYNGGGFLPGDLCDWSMPTISLLEKPS
jgi:hypothetical protein